MEGETTKRCVKCGAVKPVSEFYRNPAMKGGRFNKCKICARRDVVEGTQPTLERRYCAYCGNDITRLNWRRTTCDAPECRQKWQERLDARKRECSERSRARNKRERERETGTTGKKVRLCRICGGEIRNGNWFFCEGCYLVIQGLETRFDGNYLYVC